MSRVIRAKVRSNSCDDEFARVQIESPGVWDYTDKSPLVNSVGGIPLKDGDIVFVDVSDGYENPLILGRSTGKLNSYGKEIQGSLLFESSDGENFTIAFVKNNKLEIYNSDSVEIVVDANSVKIKSGTLTAEYSDSYSRKTPKSDIQDDELTVTTKTGKVTGGSFEMKGTVAPEGSGPFCAVPYCLLTGAPHTGTKVTGT